MLYKNYFSVHARKLLTIKLCLLNYGSPCITVIAKHITASNKYFKPYTTNLTPLITITEIFNYNVHI